MDFIRVNMKNIMNLFQIKEKVPASKYFKPMNRPKYSTSQTQLKHKVRYYNRYCHLFVTASHNF